MKTLMQISRDTKIPASTLHSAIDDGRITALKIGRDWFIELDAKWEQFLEEYKPRRQKK